MTLMPCSRCVVESGVWWRPANEWISRTAWYRVICPGPYFCGFTRGMKQGDYIEVDGQLVIHHYGSLNLTNPDLSRSMPHRFADWRFRWSASLKSTTDSVVLLFLAERLNASPHFVLILFRASPLRVAHKTKLFRGGFMNQIAANFLTRSFSSSETIALLLRREDAPRPQQRVITLEQVLAPRYMAWLAYENDRGANIYVSANPLRPGSRKRTKECIASVRHIYIDIDDDGDARLAALRASDRVPTPTAIVSTSTGKYQALWRVAGFDFEQQEQTLKLIAQAFGGDPACTDRNRVLRIPGFYNRKYSPAHRVTVEYPADATYGPADFRLEKSAGSSVLPLRGNARKSSSSKHSHSEDDWAWVCGAACTRPGRREADARACFAPLR